MSFDVEIARSVYEQLDEIADELDTTVPSLLDEITRGWLKKNHRRIMEDEPDSEEPDDDEDEPED